MTPRALGALAWLAACAGPPAGPDALFQDALALAASPDGTVWVVDGGPGVLVAFRGGAEVARWGGAGTGADAFLDPVDVDPTNGQAVFVADRAGGAVHQLTAEGRIAVSFTIPDVDPSRPLREVPADAGRARPIAVAAAPDGRLYVLDGARRHVVELSREGDVERVLTAGLADPVDLSLDGGTLWVADAGRGGLVAFDAFGTPGRFRAIDGVGRILRATVQGGEAVVVGTESVATDARGELRVLENMGGFRDALRVDGALMGVRSTALFDWSWDRPGPGGRGVD